MRHSAILLPLALATTLGLYGCGGGSDDNSTAPIDRGLPHRDSRVGVNAFIPEGWHVVPKRISNVSYPRRDLVVASYPARLKHPPRTGCYPKEILSKLPRDGVLMQLIEYSGRSIKQDKSSAAFPPRPDHFRYPRGSYANYECAGPSYKLAFRDRGRAFQVQIWMHRGSVDPRARQEALRLLDDLRFNEPGPSNAPVGRQAPTVLPQGCRPPQVRTLLEGFLGAINSGDRAAALRYIAPNPEFNGIAVSNGAASSQVEAHTPLEAFRAYARFVRGRDRLSLLAASVQPAHPGVGRSAGPYGRPANGPAANDPVAAFAFTYGLKSRFLSGKGGINCATGRIYVAAGGAMRAMTQLCGGYIHLHARKPVVCGQPD